MNIVVCFVSSFHFAYMAAFSDNMTDDERWSHILSDFVFFILFLVDIIINFFTEHHYKGSTIVERNLKKVAAIYLRGGFAEDLVALLPLAIVLDSWLGRSRAKLFYLLNLVRLRTGFRNLNYKTYMKQVKAIVGYRFSSNAPPSNR
mmetsp:Transcript_29156/g.43925  ORF Transcript_29156/g.43925 Transcript_29156/m.43925 type:complete len:146 (+) Transcript_29156:439-876(+)